MFDSLHDNLREAIKGLRGRGKLSEGNMREGLGKIREALLEADVSFPVVKDFMARVSEEAVGEKVLKSLRPEEQLVGIVHRELINLMGPVDHSLHLGKGVTVIMMCGLQGSGKTTTCGKLGRMLKQNGKKAMLCAADLQRPAAMDQLEILGGQLDLPVHVEREQNDPVKVCQNAVRAAAAQEVDVLILDTAGRLHIDDELMQQLRMIDRRVQPQQVYLVVDAMTGQDAVNSAKSFNEALELDGVVLTKLDGDARGGAALSVKNVTGVPIKFIGTGEQLDALEPFEPEGMAGRILGMGDIMALVRKAQSEFDEEEMRRQEERLKKGEFTLDDFKRMIGQTGKLGPMSKIMSLIPGMGAMKEMMGAVNDDDTAKEMRRLVGVIDSMTADERRDPKKVIDQSRRRRIAQGAGVEPHDVNALVKQFDAMKPLVTGMSNMSMRERMQKMQEISQGGMLDPNKGIKKEKVGTGRRLSPKEKAKLRKQKEQELRRKKRAGKGK